MAAENDDDTNAGLETFTDCLSTIVIDKLAPSNVRANKKRVKGRKNEIKPVEKPPTDRDGENSDATELSEFTEYLAEEIYLNLPLELRTLSYAAIQNDEGLAAKYGLPLDSEVAEGVTNGLPLTVADSLQSYGLVGKEDESELEKFTTAVLEAYIDGATAPPPEYAPETQASECEICAREHLPLTYHHLIPRQVADKAVKRGWHADWEVNKVAWLCRACHSYVHKILSNEELAREWYSVELLTSREDVQRWANWVGRVRWKAR